MAPDRGQHGSAVPEHSRNVSSEVSERPAESSASHTLAVRASEPQNFTFRGILLGLFIGIIIAFSNTYFGLQTGWVSGMAMPSALIGFAVFKTITRYITLALPFSPVENVLVQTVAGSAGTMPLGCGFVGVIPALEYLLKKDESESAINVSLPRLCVWAVGICLFGVVFAVPLRREVIIREKLKFPSGTATALIIGVLHGEKEDAALVQQQERHDEHDDAYQRGASIDTSNDIQEEQRADHQDRPSYDTERNPAAGGESDWRAKIRILSFAFAGSAAYTILTYFVPQVRNLPVFGLTLANDWLWTLNPSPAYVGQGVIMGPATTMHMLLGALVGWGILSPLAKTKGWASGPVSDWTTGSKGWIVWVSLAIMLADALVSLAWLVLRPTIYYGRLYGPSISKHIWQGRWRDLLDLAITSPKSKGYAAIATDNGMHDSDTSPQSNSTTLKAPPVAPSDDEPDADEPPEHLVSPRTLLIFLLASLALYFIAVPIAFPGIVPFPALLLALILSLFLSILGIRALGSTDLNPVSGLSKITQLIFAGIIPASTPNAIPINLLAGAVSEAAALQAGDLMQDLKTGHLLGAAPNAQFYGQLIGSVFGALVSACVYKLYVSVYPVPGKQFQVPTAFVWIFTARLVTGEGLPPMAGVFALGTGAIFAVLTVARMAAKGQWWCDGLPGGIAFAIGIYNTPSFTLARAIGGLLSWYWVRWRGRDETSVVVLASGLILGEGLFSIVNLLMASGDVPHL
ncbi:MAG: hypothetical protein M1828_000382 [Chrysothrix sp. TS-e1954]|nr:MAG: hypothetical protein M1828_000382 [Chrysothrix sp. TS-e1954]